MSAAKVGGPDNALLVINARIVGNTEVGFLLAGCRASRERFNRSDSQVKFRLLQIMRSCHSLTIGPSFCP